MKNRRSLKDSSTTSKPIVSNDKIKVAVRIRPPLLREIHEEKAFFEIDGMSI